MDQLGLQTLFSVLANFGVAGLVIIIWWYDHKQLRREQEHHKAETAKLFLLYKEDMGEMRQMYKNNVHLVESYLGLARDLKEVVMMNTQAFTRLEDAIEKNQFCPAVRLRKDAVGIIEGGGS